jgi:aminoglycoside phosphotransferase family enzyme/predicted kinase
VDISGIQQLLGSLPLAANSAPASLCETHISWVILSGEFAYKIKKPVNFGFLDFSTLALRHHYCKEELRLNRRFSPELYLDVVPVTRDGNTVVMEGAGAPIDYAVKMRRFNEDQSLDNIAARDGMDNTLLRALARELAELHNKLPSCRPNPASNEPGTPAALLAAIEQNFQQIRNYPIPEDQLQHLQAIEQWSLQQYGKLRPLMAQRLREGMVIDGHGDAHLGNIALVDGAVRLFDCIEFNACFRIMDKISEIAFLVMDMDARGYHCAAHHVLSDYLEYSGEFCGLPLLHLYMCYFAMVRAKVNLLGESLHNTGLTSSEGYHGFLRYLALAKSCTQPRQIFLAITHGVSGSGKSTVAGALTDISGAVRIRSDVERKRLASLAPEQRSGAKEKEALYSTAMTRETFSRLETLAAVTIEAGFPAIIDATFLHRETRQQFHKLAVQLGVPFVIIDCIAQTDELRRRLIERERQGTDASEANVEVMEKQLATAAALTSEEQAYCVQADSAEDPDLIWRRLENRCFGKPAGQKSKQVIDNLTAHNC